MRGGGTEAVTPERRISVAPASLLGASLIVSVVGLNIVADHQCPVSQLLGTMIPHAPIRPLAHPRSTLLVAMILAALI